MHWIKARSGLSLLLMIDWLIDSSALPWISRIEHGKESQLSKEVFWREGVSSDLGTDNDMDLVGGEVNDH